MDMSLGEGRMQANAEQGKGGKLGFFKSEGQHIRVLRVLRALIPSCRILITL